MTAARRLAIATDGYRGASAAAGGPTSVSVIVDGVLFVETLQAEIENTILEAAIVDTVLETELIRPLGAEVDEEIDVEID